MWELVGKLYAMILFLGEVPESSSSYLQEINGGKEHQGGLILITAIVIIIWIGAPNFDFPDLFLFHFLFKHPLSLSFPGQPTTKSFFLNFPISTFTFSQLSQIFSLSLSLSSRSIKNWTFQFPSSTFTLRKSTFTFESRWTNNWTSRSRLWASQLLTASGHSMARRSSQGTMSR